MTTTTKLDALIGPADWARGLGVSKKSVDNYITLGLIPTPELRILGRPRWRASTYDKTLQQLATATIEATTGPGETA